MHSDDVHEAAAVVAFAAGSHLTSFGPCLQAAMQLSEEQQVPTQ